MYTHRCLWGGVLALVACGSMASGVRAGGPSESDEPWGTGGRIVPETLKIADLSVLRAVVGGDRGGDGGLRGPGCPQQIASHTNANFGGGQFVVQAGFAEGEIAAASYVLAASAFPLKIDLLEFILATSGATQSTTTQYTVMVWEGTPSTGTLMYSFTSSDEAGDLPNAVLPPGTQGVNIQVSVDAGDPDQLIIGNSLGTNTFSIGFRIDQHHQQSGSGCNSGDIPTCCNAFPVTDVGGLASPTGNWLNAISCPLGCPAGWHTFQQLNQFCRPSGDWVMRATWESLECSAPTGRCCLTNGTCDVTTQSDCAALGGTYGGDGSSCATPCPVPTGACCFGNNCLNLTAADCAAASGNFLGNGTACASGQCPTGACCALDGTCSLTTAAACAASGGTFRGVGVACANAACPPPVGACCLQSGGCLQLTESDCGVIPNASWAGPLTTCADSNGNGQADSCEPACPADFNQSGHTTSADITAFLGAWFSDLQNGTVAADFNDSGVTTSADITAFLGAWFADLTNGCG
ncbi:MAG: hypothetical protein H7Y88_03365 [Phycisphaerales bacterium]|nr:hypothetical protein [Phycisphaerales bacterium]